MSDERNEEEIFEEDGLFDVKSHEVLPKMYLSYALSVIKDRSLPDIHDGLKPVARRILYSMHGMGLTHNKPTRKSARVIGEVMGKYHPHGDGCLVGSTLAQSLDGNTYKFKDLADENKEIWVLAHDVKANKPVPAIAHSFRVTKHISELYRVTFWNGEIIELTDNHKLEKLSGKWSRTDELKVGDIIANGIITNNEYPKFRCSNESMSIGKKLHHIVGEHVYGKAEIYHHKDDNTKNNVPDNLDPITKVVHEKIHKNYENGLRKGNETMLHGISEFRKATRKKNSEIIKAVNKKHYLFKAIKIVKMIILDNKTPTEELYKKYRTEVYNGTTLERLYMNGHTFEEIVEYAMSKEKIKLIDTSKAKGHTVGLKKEINVTNNNKSNNSRVIGQILNRATAIVVSCIEDYGLNFSISDYESIRCDFCEMSGNDFNERSYPKFSTLTKWFKITTVKQLLDLISQRHLMIIRKIEVFNVDNEPVYDFTVDKYENMYVPIGTNEKGETKLIVTHNSIYGAAVRLAQPFTTRYPLIIGQGNFGSTEDKPAAMRYTEMKLEKISNEVLADIEKETVDFVPNFDGTLQEPKVLPTKLPLFLLNGAVGIAVGMATTVAPHNLSEIVDALLEFIDDEDIDVTELIRHIKGPDFPSGAFMFNHNIQKLYETGSGSVTLRAKASIVENGRRQSIIITELPYQVDKSKLISRIAELYKDKEKKIDGIDAITDIRDESDRHGTRIVIELRRGTHGKMVLNTLYRRTNLQCKYSILMRALVNNVPKLVSLKEVFWHFIDHRKNVVVRRAEYDLKTASNKVHLLKGYIIVFDNLDDILEDIKISTSSEIIYQKLRKYKLDDEQIKAILELKIQRIAKFERSTIEAEHEQLMEKIKKLKLLLDSEELVLQTIKDELIDMKSRFGDERRTLILESSQSDDESDNSKIDQIEEVQDEEVVVTVTHNGLIKRTPAAEYRVQKVRGRGLIGVDVKDDDYVKSVFQLSSRDFTFVFTNKGFCYKMNVYDIPAFGRTASGSSILNILNLNEDEHVIKVLPMIDFTDKFFIMVTKNGKIKKLKADKLQRPRSKGTKVLDLAEGDTLIDVEFIDVLNKDILLVTKNGMCIRFNENAIKTSGKGSSGIRGIKLSDDDSVIAVSQIELNDESYLMIVTEKGYSKKTTLTKFRPQKRGGRGVICMDVNITTGKIITANVVNDDEQFIVITNKGILIRLQSDQIRKLGRSTQGSRIQKIAHNEFVASVAFMGAVSEISSEK